MSNHHPWTAASEVSCCSSDHCHKVCVCVCDIEAEIINLVSGNRLVDIIVSFQIWHMYIIGMFIQCYHSNGTQVGAFSVLRFKN